MNVYFYIPALNKERGVEVCAPRGKYLTEAERREKYSIERLREYRWIEFGGVFHLRSGWQAGWFGQEVGKVETEEEARLYCQYARECMRFRAVYKGVECEILDLSVTFDSDCLILFQGREVFARPNEWRLKIIMGKTLEEWLYDVELVLPMIERGTAARKWGISNYDAGLIIAELCLARVLPVRMERLAWLAWLETYVLEM
jgi:hypothetical protein